MKEKIILKSANPELYGDLEIECRVIENDEIGEYLRSISEEKKFEAYKTGEVVARKGTPGQLIKTVLKTVIDGKEYILNEEEGTVNLRTYEKNGKEVTEPDVVVVNISSTSNEQYIVKHQKFISTYEPKEGNVFIPSYDPRILTQVDEDIIIVTAWGSKAICLKGGYIVTYNAEENDYNTLEKGAFDSTYTKVTGSKKTLKRN